MEVFCYDDLLAELAFAALVVELEGGWRVGGGGGGGGGLLVDGGEEVGEGVVGFVRWGLHCGVEGVR